MGWGSEGGGGENGLGLLPSSGGFLVFALFLLQILCDIASKKKFLLPIFADLRLLADAIFSQNSPPSLWVPFPSVPPPFCSHPLLLPPGYPLEIPFQFQSKAVFGHHTVEIQLIVQNM